MHCHAVACGASGTLDWESFPRCSISRPAFDAPDPGSPFVEVERELGELGCIVGVRSELLGSCLNDPFTCRGGHNVLVEQDVC